MNKQERPMRHMDRDLRGAVVVINNHIVSGKRDDTTGPLAVDVLAESRVYVRDDAWRAIAELPGTPSQGDDPQPVPGTLLYHCNEVYDDVVAALRAAIAAGARVIVTVGGTGISRGDIAPEATASLLEIQMDGVVQQVRDHGLTKTPLASLSRGLVGITHRGPGGVLIVNAPGSRGGVKDSLEVVCPLLPHIFEQLDDQME